MKDGIEVFVFADALGWDLVGSSGFMRDLLPHRKSVKMQFGYSCTAIPTILSGKTPAEHGHFGLFRYAPADSPFRRWGRLQRWLRPASFWNRGRVRSLLSRLVKRIKGYTGYFQLYRMPWDRLAQMDYAEKHNLFVPAGMMPFRNLADECLASGVRHHISDWRLGDARAFPDAHAAIEAGARFVFVYTAGLDAVRHDEARSRETPRTEAKLAWYREELLRLADRLRATGRSWRITVFSDHGMTPLTETVNVQSAVDAAGLEFGVDYGACCDSTMYRVHFLREGARERIFEALRPFAAQGRWLTEEDERKWGIWREDRRFGEAIFLVNPGVQIAPSDMGGKPLAGMHGYDPEDFHSLAAAMSTGEIPSGVESVGDYFGWMADTLAAAGGVHAQRS